MEKKLIQKDRLRPKENSLGDLVLILGAIVVLLSIVMFLEYLSTTLVIDFLK